MADVPGGKQRRVTARGPWVVLLVGVVLGLATACAGPTTGAHDYRLKLANTAESLESSAQTVIMAAGLLHDGRAFQPYVANVISAAEDDATSIQQTFDSRQPPDHSSDELRQHADTTINDVISAITDARIAARASETQDLSQAADKLRHLLHDLQKLQGV